MEIGVRDAPGSETPRRLVSATLREAKRRGDSCPRRSGKQNAVEIRVRDAPGSKTPRRLASATLREAKRRGDWRPRRSGKQNAVEIGVRDAPGSKTPRRLNFDCACSSEQEKWHISIIDVIEILTGSPRPRKYWNALKTKLKVEGRAPSLL
ncbi:MAG: hypothetical protein LBT49_00325 [Prevotellaceae bacterium]|nr:hypothetical protein [Prevotellaceae bacterium]